MRSRPAQACIPHSENWDIQSPSGEHYIIQISWPLHWTEGDLSAKKQAPVM